jgi:hypothetical protein
MLPLPSSLPSHPLPDTLVAVGFALVPLALALFIVAAIALAAIVNALFDAIAIALTALAIAL